MSIVVLDSTKSNMQFFNLQKNMGGYHEKQTIHKITQDEEVVTDENCDGSFSKEIHYRMACFKLSVGVIRQCRLKRQTDGLKRRSVNNSGLMLLF